jgi:hypothetical protein
MGRLFESLVALSQVPGGQREPELHVLAIFDGYDGAEAEVVVSAVLP